MRSLLLGAAGGVVGTLLSFVIANTFHEWERRRTAERILAGQDPSMAHSRKLAIAAAVFLIAGYAVYRWVS